MTSIIDSRVEHGVRQGGRLALGLAAVAIAIFAIGLIAPLTPSEGRPNVPTLALFVGMPLVLLSVVGYRARSTPGRVICAALVAAVAGISLWLLYIQR